MPTVGVEDIGAPDPRERVRPLLRTRQVREFTDVPPTDAELHALTEVARWSGSSKNTQPWRFIVIRDAATIGRLHAAGLPQTRALRTAPAAIAIVMPREEGAAMSHAYDEGRAAERLLIAAGLLDLGAGVAWILTDVRPVAAEILGLPADRFVRTIVAIGHPSEEATHSKSAPGKARLPADDVVFEERWPPD
jgi:nitroreductase